MWITHMIDSAFTSCDPDTCLPPHFMTSLPTLIDNRNTTPCKKNATKYIENVFHKWQSWMALFGERHRIVLEIIFLCLGRMVLTSCTERRDYATSTEYTYYDRLRGGSAQ